MTSNDLSSKQRWRNASGTCSTPARGAANASRPAQREARRDRGCEPEDVIGGIIDICAPARARRHPAQWAASCMLSGECIKACDEGVNPRFLLAMARVAIAKAKNTLPERRRQGVEKYRDSAAMYPCFRTAARWRGAGAARPEIGFGGDASRDAGLRVLHRLQCAEDAAYRAARARHHGCARHHYQVMGGPSHCCGVVQLRPGDVEMSGRMGTSSAKNSHIEIRPGDLVVPELLCPVHGNDAAGDRAPARREAVRDDAVHAFP